jgi:hypothetical protein
VKASSAMHRSIGEHRPIGGRNRRAGCHMAVTFARRQGDAPERGIRESKDENS